MKSIYLDYAAATPVDAEVMAAMAPYFTDEFANPSSLYGAARVTRQALDGARATVANGLGAKPSEIIFTAGATESINLAIQGVLRKHPDGHVVTTAIEHEAVLATLEGTGHQGLGTRLVVEAGESGIVRAEDVLAAVTDQTVLVSVMLANNEIGTLQPVREIAASVQQIRDDRRARGMDLPLYLHTDAAQAATTQDLHVSRLGVDLITLNGGKMYGPKQSGILYVRTGVVLEPLLYGGGQEKGLRSGTENVAAAVGFARALELAQAQRKVESARLMELRNDLLARLESNIPDLVVNGDLRHRLPQNLNITIPGLDGEQVVLYLDNAGVQASTGSACSLHTDQPSHVLLAIGRTAAEANASLRFSLGKPTSPEDIERAAKVIIDTIKHLRA